VATRVVVAIVVEEEDPLSVAVVAEECVFLIQLQL